MDEPTYLSSSSESDFELVRENENHRPEQASDVCWIKEPLKRILSQNIKRRGCSGNTSDRRSSFSFFLSNSWLTVSLLVLLLGLTVEYKRVNDINELMSEQLKNLRRDYDQLKMHDTNQQLQILTELRALRDCGPPRTIDKPKEVESKTVENEPEAVEIKPEPEHLETKIIEEPKTVVEPQPMDIQETTVVEAKPIDEPNNEQKLNDEPNDLSCSKEKIRLFIVC
ncbi:hypothetical protein M3Y98_00912300 [Aphelenchoides besseyi]|nr:hypothetical protein M3Y98_00912300 [Aphelenchoides besseyi]